jgi:hypothetical protein
MADDAPPKRPKPPLRASIRTASPPRNALLAEEPPEPEDPVDKVIAQSFPASDPPSWWTGTEPRDR